MPGNIKSSHRGITVEFKEEGHTYDALLPQGKVRLRSVTEFIHSFVPPFDVELMSGICARKEGISKEEMKRRWEEKRDRSCFYGTMVHETMEDVFLGRDLRRREEEFREGNEKRTFLFAPEMARRIMEKFEIMEVEKMVFSLKYRLAGTIDYLCRPRGISGTVLVGDHKTNGDLDRENRYGKMFFPPLNGVSASSWGCYCLQLSMYQVLLEEEGYVEKGTRFGRVIDWLVEGEGKMLKVPDMTREARALLDFRLEELQRGEN